MTTTAYLRVSFRERIALMSLVEIATGFGVRRRPRERHCGRRNRRRATLGEEEGDIDASVLGSLRRGHPYMVKKSLIPTLGLVMRRIRLRAG